MNLKLETEFGDLDLGIGITYQEAYIPANFDHPAEGGELEYNITEAVLKDKKSFSDYMKMSEDDRADYAALEKMSVRLLAGDWTEDEDREIKNRILADQEWEAMEAMKENALSAAGY